MQAHADDLRQRLVQRLAQQDRLGLDAADAVAEDAQAADHRRVRVGAHERVGEGHGLALLVLAQADHVAEELEVDLVDDAGAGRHDAEAAERGLGPAQQLVALAVALVLALHVEGEGLGCAEAVDLDGVVDDQVGRHQRVDPGRIATELGHGVAHGREVDHGGDAGEVLQQHAAGHERDLDIAAGVRAPVGEGGDVVRGGRARGRLRSTFSSRTLTVKGSCASRSLTASSR